MIIGSGITAIGVKIINEMDALSVLTAGDFIHL